MAAAPAAACEELQRPAHGGDQQHERGRLLRATVVPRETPAAETSHPEAEAGEQESPGEEEQPPRGSPLVSWRTQRLWMDDRSCTCSGYSCLLPEQMVSTSDVTLNKESSVSSSSIISHLDATKMEIAK